MVIIIGLGAVRRIDRGGGGERWGGGGELNRRASN